ncbi:fasciclin-like arabinogalactan protein 21 [Magnolia sinica]|uniref:fasciclin-like arabinogalactan protein 21 n=1 Tax=Magnolia sinica TaxID=86752 RepID=UPI002657B3A6|nr:fasciclin-like arabinogalactan protein 21 [Magnolia sinica]
MAVPTHSGLALVVLLTLVISQTTAITQPPLQEDHRSSTSPSYPPSQDLHDSSTSTNTISHGLLAPILGNLGFQELALAVPSLSQSSLTRWVGPATVFAPADDSIRTCPACSVPRILREHIVPGVFSLRYLSKLAFGTKIETISPERCITVTTSISAVDNVTRIFVDGVEITQPDLFNDGTIVIHGLRGYISTLSPLSCKRERMPNPLSSPPSLASAAASSIVRLMLRDAMLRLRDTGYSVLSLALRVKYAELLNLQNMTIFALDDASIFAGGHSYVSNVRFHIVPNRFLMHADLLRMPVGTTLQTLVHGQALVLTGAADALRINYVPLKIPDAMYNLKIVVHNIFLPFPHLQLMPFGASEVANDNGIFESSVSERRHEACSMAPAVVPMVEAEDDGL